MKIDEKTIFNVLLALVIFRVAGALFLDDMLDGITDGFERSI